MTDQIVEEERASYGGGHIKLHRALLESSLWAMRPEDKVLAIYLLLRANWKDAEWFNKWQRKRITVRRGELISSLDNLATGSGLTKKVVRTSLKHLVSDGFIEIFKNDGNRAQQFTHIRICKYETYQTVSGEAGTQRARDGHGMGTQRALNEERKNNKKEKNKYSCPKFAQFWGLYAKPIEKPNAYKEWEKLTEERKDQVLKVLNNGYQWPSEKRFIPYPAKWLKQERWTEVQYPERKYKDSTYDPASPDYIDAYERLARLGEKH